MGKLSNKVAIVTGAGRGHAEAIARLFAKEGAILSICDIIPLKELERTVGSEISAEGGQVLCFQTDVSKEDQVNKMVQKTIKELGTIDILVNVVGMAGPTLDVWDIPFNVWKRTLAVNLDSLFLCTKAVLPEMINKKSGRIINYSSGAGKVPLPHRSPYTTTKMGVIGFTRTLAAEVGRFNITANTVCPGWSGMRNMELAQARAKYLGKPFNEDEYKKQMEEYTQKGVLAGRWLTGEGYLPKISGPQAAANVTLFLASDDASMITGQDINTTDWVMW
ncbi:SDR family oxidoreductase [Candidatus Bathyarchaeota archaeon]|nr:SDR family oxidoreductase [Candidatus Bathyarchaeota archaeon]